MSATPHGATIDRREVLRRTALLLGAMISGPTLAGILAGCETPAPATGESAWTPRALTAAQGEQVATIAEHIIPATDTPGARAAGVHRFIDTMLAEYYSSDERATFVAGLAEVDRRAKEAKGTAFLALAPMEQRELLRVLDAEAYRAAPGLVAAPVGVERGGSENATADQPRKDSTSGQRHSAPQPFFRTMKELTLLGYYTSNEGATRELRYAPVPGRFDGCVPFATVGRAWAT